MTSTDMGGLPACLKNRTKNKERTQPPEQNLQGACNGLDLTRLIWEPRLSQSVVQGPVGAGIQKFSNHTGRGFSARGPNA
jgi:hypothetical protein